MNQRNRGKKIIAGTNDCGTFVIRDTRYRSPELGNPHFYKLLTSRDIVVGERNGKT